MFAVICKCAVFFLLISYTSARINEDVEVFKPEPTKYGKLIEVKTIINSRVNRAKPIIGVFQDNNIESVNHEAVIKFRNRQLLLTDYGIDEIEPGAFKNLGGYIDLILKRNKLKSIKKGIFNHVADVFEINLCDNEISFIEAEAFNNIPDLITIELSNNSLKNWNSNWFMNTPKLTWFWFHNNSIEDLPEDAFKNMGETKIVGGNVVGINLMFKYNNIKTIHPTAFKGIQILDTLWLRHNLIDKFPGTLLEGIAVKEIDVSGNNLSCIPKSSAYNESTKLQPSLCEK